MKKLILITFTLGLITSSCGSKEKQLSSENDSMTISSDKDSSDILRDTPMIQNSDTVPMREDTVAASAR